MAAPTASTDPELEALFARLSAAGDEAAYQDALAAVSFELIGRLKSSPALAAKLEAMLATGDRHHPAVRVAVGALAGAGTAEAQAALARLATARAGDRSFLELLIPTMGFAVKPSPALEGALRRLAAADQPADVRSMAQLALGITAAHLRDDDPERARQIVAVYDARLAQATRPDEIGTYLSVLGNAATPEAAQAVARYLHDERGQVRADAVEALRLVPTAEAAAELTDALLGDPDSAVRARAAWALGYRANSVEAVHAQAEALSGERDLEVARRLLDNLWAGRNLDGAGALAALTAAAASHPVAEVREQARSLLAQASSGKPAG